MAGAFRRDHENVQVAPGFDQIEVNVESMSSARAAPFFRFGSISDFYKDPLELVRRQNHDDIGDLGGLRERLDGQPLAFRLAAEPNRAQRDNDVRDAAFLQVQGMSVALAAVTDNDNGLHLDQIHIGVLIVINAHRSLSSNLCCNR